MKRTLTAIVLLLAAPAAAEDAAERILALMANHLDSLDSYTVHVERNFDDVMVDGAKVQFAGAVDIAVRNSDGIHILYGDDLSAKEFWYDGRTFTLLDLRRNVYMREDAKSSMSEAVTQLQEEYGVLLPLMTLLRGNPAEDYGSGVAVRRYVGLHDVEGIPCHHLLFRGERVDLQLWIQDGDTPLLRKSIVTYKHLAGAPQASGVLTEWTLNPELKDSVFEADLPEDAIRADVLKK